jgi:hypothetical protein
MWHRLEEQPVSIVDGDTVHSNYIPNDLDPEEDIEDDLEDTVYDPADDLGKGEDSVEMDDSDDEESDFHVIQSWTFRTCWHYKFCYVCIYIVLVIVLLSPLIALIVVILLVVLPFTRVSTFCDTMCEVTSASTHMADSTCSCGKGCDSRYPCIKIQVQYTDLLSGIHNASIHENEVLLDKEVSVNKSVISELCLSTMSQKINIKGNVRLTSGNCIDYFLFP